MLFESAPPIGHNEFDEWMEAFLQMYRLEHLENIRLRQQLANCVNPDGQEIWINDPTYGNQGIQLQYNNGTPRFYCGDGSTNYFEFDGTNVTYSGQFAGAIAGDALIAESTGEGVGPDATPVKVLEGIIGRAGTWRIKFDLKCDNGLPTAYGQIYKNGAAHGTERSTTSTSYVTYSEDLTFDSPTDLIQLYLWEIGTADNSRATNFKIYTGNPPEAQITVDF